VLNKTFALANMANVLLAKGRHASQKDFPTPAFMAGGGINPRGKQIDLYK